MSSTAPRPPKTVAPTPAAPGERAWWVDLYDDHLADFLLERSPEELADTAAFLFDVLGLKSGARVFDQCCGRGALSIALAQRGCAVVGVDQARRYIERGLRDAWEAGVAVELHVGDAFAFVPDRPVDGAFNWCTSFGHALDDRANFRMVERAYEALRPGGRFALDVMNLPGVLRGMQRDMVSSRETLEGEIVLHRRTSVDAARGAMLKRWTYFLPNGQRVVHDTETRLYLPHTVGEMLTAAGFVGVRFLGGTDHQELGLDSPRLIVVGCKPS